MINFQKMMQQAQQVQFKLQELQEKLSDVEVTGEAAGGMVSIRMTCKGQVRGISIDPSLINPSDKETLEDLIVAALNNANTAKDERVTQETQGIMEGLGLPPGMKLPM